MLDTPNFFWDSEPTLHPLYTAVREYLEIKPRIQVLNERCRVFLDLGEILSDSISDKKMTRITWIIIVLIGISICVTCLEVCFLFRSEAMTDFVFVTVHCVAVSLTGILQVLLRFAILHGKGQAVNVADLRRSSVAGPTLLMGRTVAWSIKTAKALVRP